MTGLRRDSKTEHQLLDSAPDPKFLCNALVVKALILLVIFSSDGDVKTATPWFFFCKK